MAISFEFSYTFIILSCVVGMVFGVINWFAVFNIKVDDGSKVEDKENLVKDNPLKIMNITSEKIQKVTFLFIEGGSYFLDYGIFLSWHFLGCFRYNLSLYRWYQVLHLFRIRIRSCHFCYFWIYRYVRCHKN